MNSFRIALGCSLSLLLLAGCGAPRSPLASATQSTSKKFGAKWVLKTRSPLIPGELVVETRPGFGTQALRAFSSNGTRPLQHLRIEDHEFTLLEVAQPEKTPEIIAQLRSNPQIQSVAPNPRYMALGAMPARPLSYASAPQTRLRRFGETPARLNDAFFNLQWALPKIGIPTAWSLGSPGNKQLLVAVVDSGVDYQHPDLKDQIINGKDFMAENPTGPNGEGSPDVVDDDPLDQMGHGTHVAGIIGALPDNATGIAGIAPGVSILNIRVLNNEGWGSAFAIAQGISYAVDNGARIINLSLGSGEPSKPIELAVKYAQKKGVLIVAAAGNSFTHTGYPASYPGVLAVGATNEEDWLADFSNHDARINVVAPGVDIMSTTPTFLTNTMAQNGIDSFYSVMSGTSMACPMVTAQAALLLSQNPALKAEQLIELIEKSAKPVGDPRIFGHGRIQIDASLQMLASTLPPTVPPAGPPPAPPADPATIVQPPADDVSQLPAPVAAQRVRRY
ncbi:MAG TPA: S8 family peptidase [Candidatus Obscuribacterales bacterium]